MLVFFFQVVLSEEAQTLLEVMLQMAKFIADKMDQILPLIGQLQNYMISIQDLNLVANNEFKQVCKLVYCTVFIHSAFTGLSMCVILNLAKNKEWKWFGGLVQAGKYSCLFLFLETCFKCFFRAFGLQSCLHDN